MRWNELGYRSESAGLNLWCRLGGLSPRPLSWCMSCRWQRATKSTTEVKNGTEDEIRTTRVICTHSIKPLSPLLFSTNFCHLLTTSSIVGRFLGLCCQQLSKSFHISSVSPTARAFSGISGRPPREIRSTTASFFCSSNGILPVNTSTANIPKANTSAAFDSITGMLLPLRTGVMISGASHLEVPTAPGVAATVKLGSELIGASPYSVKRARPLRSMTTFACRRRISTIKQPRKIWEEILTLQLRRLKNKQRDNPPPSNLHAGYQVNEDIPTPSQRHVATVRKEITSVLYCSFHSNKGFPHQGRSRCVGVQRYVLADVAIVPPVVHEGKLKDCRSDAMKRQDILMG